MPKNTAKKKGARKGAKKINSPTHAAALAALKRGVKVLEEAVKDGGIEARMEPGTHQVALTIDIAGDLVQAEPVKGETAAKGEATFTAEAVLHALCVGKPRDEVESMIGEALSVLKKAATNPRAETELSAARAMYEGARDTVAKRRDFWRETQAKPFERAGALTGAPYVRVTGTIDNVALELDVDTGGESESEGE